MVARNETGVIIFRRPSFRQATITRVRRTKINSPDPPLLTVRTAYATPPFLPFFHPPIQLAGIRPYGPLDHYRRLDCSAISGGKLLQVGVAQIHI